MRPDNPEHPPTQARFARGYFLATGMLVPAPDDARPWPSQGTPEPCPPTCVAELTLPLLSLPMTAPTRTRLYRATPHGCWPSCFSLRMRANEVRRPLLRKGSAATGFLRCCGRPVRERDLVRPLGEPLARHPDQQRLRVPRPAAATRGRPGFQARKSAGNTKSRDSNIYCCTSRPGQPSGGCTAATWSRYRRKIAFERKRRAGSRLITATDARGQQPAAPSASQTWRSFVLGSIARNGATQEVSA